MIAQRPLRIFITGATGFVGRHTCKALVDAGHSVTAIARRNTAIPNVTCLEGGIGTIEAMAHSIASHDVVVHMAAVARPVTASDFTTVNINGTEALMRATAPHIPVVLISTGGIYGNVDPVHFPVPVTHPPAPLDPYTSSKLAQEAIVTGAPNPSSVLRISNAIGTGQGKTFFIPKLFDELAQRAADTIDDTPVSIGSIQGVTRDFIDVRDVAQAILLSCQHVVQSPQKQEPLHVSSGTETALSDVIDLMHTLWPHPFTFADNPHLPRSAILRQALDNTTIKDKLGWNPRYALHNTLQWMIAEQIALGTHH